MMMSDTSPPFGLDWLMRLLAAAKVNCERND